jgi:D-3-phosphoglycerate dehydrogenase
MRVLVADAFEQNGIDGLLAAGCEVVHRPNLADAALAAALRETGADVLVVRGTRVTGEMLEGSRLSLVVRAGAGYNTIDTATASRRGIYVSNCPGRNAAAVAELTFGLILALDRRIPDNVADLRAGRWNKKEYSKARGLLGRTLGLIGFGSIAQEVAHRAQAFGMPVAAWSRRWAHPPAKDLAIAARPPDVQVAPSLEALAEMADVVSVHLALAPETRGLLGTAVFERMRPGTLFVNTSRGEVVDQAALERAVKAGGVRAALDVFATEPSGSSGSFDDPIVSIPGVYGTHHIGGSTDQAQEAIAAEAVRIISTYLATGKVPNVVNLARKTPATHVLVVRHRDRPGVLAHVFNQLRAAGLNVQETENVVFEGAEAAVARIHVDGEPAGRVLQSVREGNEDILDLHMVTI